MALSTITLESILDACAGEGAPDPRNAPSGYGDTLALRLGNNVISDFISERFNWKWNRGVAAPFLTNSWQQDYPQVQQAAGIIGWGEDCDILDVNNTAIPKPLNWDGPLTWRRQLSRTSIARWKPNNVCWLYNYELSWGTWPGAAKVFAPLITPGANGQNAIMNFVDGNGNYLVLSTASQQNGGTTGSVAPSAPASSAEGVTVTDGTLTWVVVSGTSQGFRLDWLPNATGPVFQIMPYYQIEAPKFTVLSQLLTPIPDSYSQHFHRGMKAGMFMASSNPQDVKRGEMAYGAWLKDLEDAIRQGNKERDVYGLVPQNAVTEPRWGWRGPYTADDPV